MQEPAESKEKLASKPCAACPYLKSAPRGVWAPHEFARVVAQDHPMGNTFGCHLNATREHKDLCVGWLADQKRRGVPSIKLRLVLMHSDAELDRLDAVDEKSKAYFGSIKAMVNANRGKLFPKKNKKAIQLLKKLGQEVP